MVYKVSVKDMDSPVKFNLNYGLKVANRRERPMNKLFVYTSFDDKEPDKTRHQQSFITPLSFKVFAPFKAKKFDCKNLYVGLQSEQGCSIQLCYSF